MNNKELLKSPNRLRKFAVALALAAAAMGSTAQASVAHNRPKTPINEDCVTKEAHSPFKGDTFTRCVYTAGRTFVKKVVTMSDRTYESTSPDGTVTTDKVHAEHAKRFNKAGTLTLKRDTITVARTTAASIEAPYTITVTDPIDGTEPVTIADPPIEVVPTQTDPAEPVCYDLGSQKITYGQNGVCPTPAQQAEPNLALL